MEQPKDFAPEIPAPTLVTQPTAAPTRKLQFGMIGGALVVALVAGMSAYDAELGATWGPIIFALAGALGVVVPAYVVKNRAP